WPAAFPCSSKASRGQAKSSDKHATRHGTEAAIESRVSAQRVVFQSNSAAEVAGPDPGSAGRTVLVQSLNFEFLRPQVPLLANLGGFAEKYAFSDPKSAAVKLRNFLEELVEQLYQRHRLARPYQAHLVDLLDAPDFTAATPKVIVM